MKRLLLRLHSIELAVTLSALTLVIFLVFFSALFRWVGFPIQWAADVAQLLFAWIVFLGADIALASDRHIGIEFLEEKLPPKIRQGLSLVWCILTSIFLVICIYFGVQLCLQNHLRRFNGMPISYSWMTLSVPVGSLLMLITSLSHISRIFKKLKEI